MTTPILFFIVLYTIVYFIEGSIFYLYCSKLFVTDEPKKTIFSAYILLYVVLFGISFFESININILAFTIVNFLILIIVYHTNLAISLLHALITTCINTFSELAVLGLTQQYSNTIRTNTTFLIILTIVSKIMYFLFLMIVANLFSIGKIMNNEPENPSSKKSALTSGTSVLLMLIPIMSVYLVSILFDILLINSIDRKSRHLLSSCAIIIILINIFVFFIYYYVLHKNNELNRLNVQYQKEYDMAQYYKELFAQNENQRILIHDIRKHLSSIMELNKINDRTRIQQYLDTLLNLPELQKTVCVSDNEMLNSIVCHYIKMCNDKNISMKIDIRKNAVKYLDYTELTSLFCNLLDNSVEACTNVKDSYIELNVSEQENSVFTVISIKNTCKNTPQFDKKNRPLSSKKEKPFHGLGIKSIERVIKKYDGEMTMLYDDDDNEFQTIIYLKDPTSQFLLQNK